MIRLIINADDFGLSKEVNEAINRCFIKGIINRTTVMVNMPAYTQAVEMAKANNYFDKIGLHINLIEGVPLTQDIKQTIFCTNGVFNGEVFKKTLNRFWFDKKTRGALEKELRAQIEEYINAGFSLLHVDSHEHSHTNYSVMSILIILLSEYGFRSIRLSRNIPRAKIKGPKSIYKKMFNAIISNFNNRNGIDLIQVDSFGSITDIEQELENKQENMVIELMVHPIMYTDKIEDAINEIGIEDWLDHCKLDINWR